MICWIGACAFGVDARLVHIPARCGCDGPGLGRSPTPLSVDDCGFSPRCISVCSCCQAAVASDVHLQQGGG